jgi:threonine/homoserine/homoserine lactone efflux protein
MTIWAFLIQGIGFGFAAAVQPGPFQAFLISRTLSRGWRRTLPAALAPLVSDGPIILLCLFVLSRVPPWFQRSLYLAGGLFLLYLAFGAFRAWRKCEENAEIDESAGRQTMLHAALVNAVNPGPYLYWTLVTGPILLAGWRADPAYGIGFLVSFYAAIVLTLAAMILVFGKARALGPRFNRALLGVSALALAGFGLYQLWMGLSGV